MEPVTWTPHPGRQTAALKAAGLTVDALKAAGFRWCRAQRWEAEPTPAAMQIAATLSGMPGALKLPAVPDGVAAVATDAAVSTDKLCEPYRADGPSPAAIDRARSLADRLDAEAEKGERQRDMNTPKRMAQAMHARMEAAKARRAAALLRAWADDPGKLADWKPNKADALEAVRRRLENVPNGYHSYHVETTEPADTASPTATSLRAAYGIGEAEESKAAKIERMEAALRFSPIEGFFPTPTSLIKRIIELADIRPDHRVLEPSAGKGDLADAARDAGGAVVCCEIAGRLREILTAKGHTIIADDFMEWEPSPVQDRIVANPPFERGQDRDHIRRMFEHLAPGGRLVAVCSTGPFFRSCRADEEFREWLNSIGAEVEDVEAGAFNGSDAFRRTGIAVKLVVIDKEA